MSADPVPKTVNEIVRTIDGDAAGNRLLVPRFQRTVVWNRKKQMEFVDSVQRGFPVGAILWWRAPSQDSVQGTTYVLVDGLQRTYALKCFLDQPLVLMRFELLPQDIREKLQKPFQAAVTTSFDAEAFARGVDTWLSETKRCEMGEGFEADSLSDHVRKALNLEAWTREPERREVRQALDHLRRFVESIKDRVIPVILWDGSKEELPDAFERLNRTAQKLTAYDLLAAQWHERAVRVTDRDVQGEIEAKYDALADADMDVEDTRGFDDLPDPDSLFNLYEYLMGLGRKLAKDYSGLFRPPDDTEFENPGWAFTAATIAHGLRAAYMEKLPDQFAYERNGIIDPSSFQAAFTDSLHKTWEWLSPFLDVRLNRKSRTSLVREHAEFQMVSLVVGVLLACWRRGADGRWSERPDAKTNAKILQRTLPQHYLWDILEGEWQGAGDAKAFNRVWDTSVSPARPSEHYLQAISREALGGALDRWFEREGIERVQKDRPYIRSVEKMVLRFVYAQILRVAQDRAGGFDIDHLFPVKRLVERARAEDQGWPISSVANLALLDVRLNRGKRELTLAEALHRIRDEEDRDAKRRRIEELVLCEIDDISVSENLTRDQYVGFLRKRWKSMRDHILSGLYDSGR